jgi:hypothetical protein
MIKKKLIHLLHIRFYFKSTIINTPSQPSPRGEGAKVSS